MMDGFGNWGMWMAGGLGMVVFWVAVIALVIWGVRALAAPRDSRAEVDALEILRRRYASGEISEAEYEQARRTLS